MTPPAPPALPDAEARRRIAEDLDTTFVVEAAAGTGKTTALVERIATLLRRGAGTLDRIAAVTFTEKAAGEMKLRLRERIEAVRTQSPDAQERARLDASLEHLELAHIGTIHAFCAELLRLHPVEAGVDPLFEVSPEDRAARLRARAFESWFQQVLAAPPEGVRRLLRRPTRGADARGPRAQLAAAVDHLTEHRDFHTPWRRDAFDRERAIDELMDELAALGALAARAEREDDYLAQNLAEVQRFVDEVRHLEGVQGRRDPDGLEALLRNLRFDRRVHWHWRGSPRRRFARDLPRAEVLEHRDRVKAQLDALVQRCDADLAPLLQEELQPVLERYAALKRSAGLLDFVDLLVGARDLLLRDAGVRTALQERFSHFFVDEFQDTDPLQAEILLLLSADDPEQTDWRGARPVPGKLFVVGDPKQSIYRFRRADVALYAETRRRLQSCGAELLHLSTSFRSVPEIQSAVNAAFAPHMSGPEGGSQADYVPLQPHRAPRPEQPAVVALPVPRPYGDYGKIVNFRIEESFPDAVGAFVDWLVRESGWTVSESGAPEKLVPLRPRHVCLLFRRFQSWRQDVTRPYVRALEARGVPHVLVGGRSFHEREEVMALRSALTAIEWPDDALRVYATLRGPLFGLGDDALLAWQARARTLHPLAPRPEAGGEREQEVADALDVLARLHRRRNRRPIAETLTRLLAEVRAHAGIAIWPTGEQALANVLRIVDLARRFERQGATSFRSFVEQLEADAERGEVAEAPIVEEGTEGVRVMTVHRAKGLEFPVVILADPTANRTGRNPSRHVDPERGLWAEPLCGCAPPELLDAAEEELRRDEQESVRIAYVAATRARDLLVVPTLGDERPKESWLDLFHPAVYPVYGEHRASRPAPGCPAFGEDSVLERPGRAGRNAESSVRPGLQRPRAGEHDVVWWDPGRLALDAEESVGLRQERILAADASGAGTERGQRAYEAWQAARRDALSRGERPLAKVQAVTALSTGAPVEGAPVLLERTELDRAGRPGGRRFGTLVHASLAEIDLAADGEVIRETVSLQGRLVGASESELAAALEAVRAALRHPLLLRAAQSAALRRETPLAVLLEDGVLAEGIVDLAFREAGGKEDRPDARWLVVDFKTDREIEAHRADYEAQVRLYARAVTAATGEPAQPTLLVV